MRLATIAENDNKVLKVEGRIDTSTSGEFEDCLLKELKSATVLFIDLQEVVYVSSAGLRAFLNGQKCANKNNADMILTNVNDTVMEVFEMTGFINVLHIEGRQ